jgi:hypothetical protein
VDKIVFATLDFITSQDNVYNVQLVKYGMDLNVLDVVLMLFGSEISANVIINSITSQDNVQNVQPILYGMELAV